MIQLWAEGFKMKESRPPWRLDEVISGSWAFLKPLLRSNSWWIWFCPPPPPPLPRLSSFDRLCDSNRRKGRRTEASRSWGCKWRRWDIGTSCRRAAAWSGCTPPRTGRSADASTTPSTTNTASAPGHKVHHVYQQRACAEMIIPSTTDIHGHSWFDNVSTVNS